MSDLPPLPADPEQALTLLAKEAIHGCNNVIKAAEKAENDSEQFRRVISKLARQLWAEVYRLGLKENTSIPELGWAARNILELRVWTAYVLKSSANLARFENDWVLDALGFMEALEKWQRKVKPNEPPLKNFAEMITALKEDRFNLNLTHAGILKTSELAVDLGLSEEFSSFNKITSKIVHPTAWSVLQTFDMNTLKNLFVPIALMLAGNTLIDIWEHAEKHGMNPKP